jgi:FtsH-binding integral membrane protein
MFLPWHMACLNTSNVLHHYPEDRYVAAALELFASVALMLWYVLRLLMRR